MDTLDPRLGLPSESFVNDAHALSMMALQSDRYSADPDYRDAVDAVLAWTAAQRAMAIDERLGLPSASSMHRAAACPGSVALEAQCLPEPPGPDAERGTRIHRWLSHRDVELAPDEMEIAQACERMMLDALSEWAGTMPSTVINQEERLWLYGPKERRFEQGMSDTVWPAVCSGQPDIVYAQGNRALVVDFKTGFAEGDPAEINYQLRTLAVLVAENSAGEIDEVTCCFIAPNVSRKVSLVTYTADDLLTARAEILGICERTRDPDAPRIPGESQCRHCRGRLRCPEARAEVGLVNAAHPRLAVVDFSPDAMAKFLDICATADVVIKAAREEAKRRLEADPNSVPGWMLAEGNEVRECADIEGAYRAMEGEEPRTMSHARILACMKLQIGKLEDAFVEDNADSFATKKAAHGYFRAVVAPYITLKQNAPSLKRVKEITE